MGTIRTSLPFEPSVRPKVRVDVKRGSLVKKRRTGDYYVTPTRQSIPVGHLNVGGRNCRDESTVLLYKTLHYHVHEEVNPTPI